MKVLFIQKEGGIFGAEQYQLNIIPALVKRGVDLNFLRLYTDYQGGRGGEFIKRLNSMGVETFEVRIKKYPDLGSLREIHRIIKAGSYDIVHSHLIHADFYTSLLRRFPGFQGKFVSTKHGYDNEYTSLYGFNPKYQKKTRPYYLLSRFSELTVDKSITISNGLRNFFIETGLTKSDTMELIHYGFDIPDVQLLRDSNKYRHFSKQIFIAGRLVKFKGHHHLLNALSEVLKIYPEAGLVVAGTGIEEASLKAQAKKMNIQEKVLFLGYSKEVSLWMYASDLVAVPSISEGFGVVFLEAFAARTPVVSFNVPAGNELMEHNISGFLAQPYSCEDLAKKIVTALGDKALCEKVSEKAYENLRSYFTLDRMADETISFYRNILNE